MEGREQWWARRSAILKRDDIAFFIACVAMLALIVLAGYFDVRF